MLNQIYNTLFSIMLEYDDFHSYPHANSWENEISNIYGIRVWEGNKETTYLCDHPQLLIKVLLKYVKKYT